MSTSLLDRRGGDKYLGTRFEANGTGNGNLSLHNNAAVITVCDNTTMVRPSGGETTLSSDGDRRRTSRIVSTPFLRQGPGQGSRDSTTRFARSNRAPEDNHTHEFGEHEFSQNSKEAQAAAQPNIDASTLIADSIQHHNTNTQDFASSTSSTKDKINNPLATSGSLGKQVVGTNEGGMPGQSWVASDAHTTVLENSNGGNQLKPAEQSSRETLLDPTTHPNYNIHRRPQDYKPQQSGPGITLATLSQPLQQQQHHPHAATAAEIALGISSPYNRGSLDHSQDDTRNPNRNLMIPSDSSSMDFNSVLLNRSLYEGKDRDEDHTSRTSDTGAVSSPGGRMTPLNDSSDIGHELPRSMVGTPSTVSTAPSTDDASLGTDYKLEDSLLPHLLQESPGYGQGHSWSEESLLPGMPTFGGTQGGSMDQPTGGWVPPHPAAAHRAWGIPPRDQSRVASFRRDGEAGETDFHNQSHQTPLSLGNRINQGWIQQTAHQAMQSGRLYGGDPHNAQQYNPSQTRNVPMEIRQGQGYQEQQPFGAYPGSRKQGYNVVPSQHGPHPPHSMIPPSSATPPRNPRNSRIQGQNNPRQIPSGNAASPHQSNANPQRSSSEILKTLLRKKACLYEPDTSRAVALVTWLVGKELALEYGFFSRQQLQSGVHECVSDKIDSGIITRTKVNRCMQIILNSCFHYIIPRSDGTEEKGDSFRRVFGNSIGDDSFLLQYLPAPWNDLKVSRAAVIEAALEEDHAPQQKNTSFSTPKSSPKLTSATPERSPGKDSTDGDAAESKRAVLLCFNENVRSAEDVFRCHNEFIRDTANAAQLQLTAQEWRTFFGREAARAPYLWGNVAIPITSGDTHGGNPRQPDALGQMCEEEVGKFRTTWCTKRYDHDHDLCGFAHVEVNRGWQRRNPSVHPYQDKMCQFISTAGDQHVSSGPFFINECPRGVACEYAHSTEELLYHPSRYKSKVCPALSSRPGGCRLGDVCPDLHPPDSARLPKKQPESRQHAPRNPKKQEQASGNVKNHPVVLPTGSPVVYVGPAPFSSFERQLAMPGLQSLYRRQSSVVRAYVRSDGKCKCMYSCFGDDWGIY